MARVQNTGPEPINLPSGAIVGPNGAVIDVADPKDLEDKVVQDLVTAGGLLVLPDPEPPTKEEKKKGK